MGSDLFILSCQLSGVCTWISPFRPPPIGAVGQIRKELMRGYLPLGDPRLVGVVLEEIRGNQPWGRWLPGIAGLFLATDDGEAAGADISDMQ